MEPLKKINVFWIDDQFEELRPFRVNAEQHGIILHGYTSAEEGLPIFEERLRFFDAVLFDALFFRRKDQERNNVRLDGLSEAIAKVNQLSGRKVFKPFILTGQERLEKSADFKDTYGDFYSKRNPADVQRLFRDIRAAAEDMADTQIRHRHQTVFDVCTDQYIGEAAGRVLLNILRSEVDGSMVEDPKSYIKSLRDIVEDLFSACSRVGLVPDAFTQGKVALNETSKFLSGQEEKGYCIKGEVVPKVVSELIRNLLAIAQPASHRAHIDKHIKLVQSPYLLYSAAYMLLDVLLWFKTFSDANPDVEANKEFSFATTPTLDAGPLVSGKVLRVHPVKGIGEFVADGEEGTAFIPPELIVRYTLKAGMRIAVRTRPSDKRPVVTHVELLPKLHE